MSILRVQRIASPILGAALAWLLLAGIAGAQGLDATALELRLPPEGTVGQEMTLSARLTNETGVAVVGAEVVFLRAVRFMNVGSDLELGRTVTDEQGTATLSVVHRGEGEMMVTARFDGNTQYGPASASGSVHIQPGPPQYVEKAGVRIPGINVYLLAGILGTVWTLYFVVMTLILLIAREGSGLADI
ncbi:MAG: hypothetical protein Q7K03_05220 [Dehalococcoidia bacterium]|nr:hypothetical protein [Dehalococcoidia bacterium]